MGRLTFTLAFAGLRGRRLQAVLTLLVVAAATAALTVALGIGRVADRPFERTFEATRGAHVTATSLGRTADLARLESLPGVTASTGDVPLIFTGFRHEGRRFGLRLLGAGSTLREVARPLVVEGTWPRTGEVLLERSFARFLGYAPGDRIAATGGRLLVVSGIAVYPLGQAYPLSQPGLAFAGRSTLALIQPDASRWGHAIGVRLDDPEAAPILAARVQAELGPAARVGDWTEERADATELARTITVILGIFSTLLLLTVGAVLATLVGGRVTAQVRQVGVLKATGLTPRHVAGLFLIEQVSLAALGCGLGVLSGRLATPLFTSESAALLAASETPPLDAGRTAAAVAVVLGLVAIFTLTPALRAAGRTTADILHGGLSRRAGHSRLGRLTRRLRLPLPVTLGVRGSFARPGRDTLTLLSLSLTVVAVVATLGMEASLDVAVTPPPAPALDGLQPDVPAWDPVDDDAGEGATLRPIVYGLDVLLLFVGLVNLVATLILTTRERIRDLGVLKAVGLTPRQLLGSVLSSQVLLAGLAAIMGIPLGLALFRLGVGLSGSADEFAYPPWWSLPLVATGVVLAVAVLTAPLARRAAALRVVDALRYE